MVSYDESGSLNFSTLQHGFNASHGLHAGVFFSFKIYQLGCASGRLLSSHSGEVSKLRNGDSSRRINGLMTGAHGLAHE
jgi:hypothetical protein